MGIRIGNLSVARNVKRIYVGVDGKARRVTKVRAKAAYKEGLEMSGVVYKDTERLQIKSLFNFGNISPVVCRVFWSDDAGKYLVSGTFKSSNQLSQLAVSVSGSAVDNGHDMLLSDSASDYTKPAPIEGGQVMLFSGTLSKKIFVKRVNVSTNTEVKSSETDTSSFSFTTSYAVASSPQHGYWNMSNESFPPANFVSVNEYGDKIIATYSSYGGAGKSFVFSYKTNCHSVAPIVYDTVAKRMVVKDLYDGDIKIVDLVGWYTSGGAFSKLLVTSTYTLSPAEFASDPLYIGPGTSNARAYNSSGEIQFRVYACTVCNNYNDTTRGKVFRRCCIVLDYGGWVNNSDGSSVPVHSVKQWTVEHELSDSELARADKYIWKYLGYDNSGNQYVLSTMEDVVKIIKFSTENGELNKVGEFDTGIVLSDNVVLQDTVINRFGFAQRSRNLEAVPAFVITRNNEYNELVIVPPELIV